MGFCKSCSLLTALVVVLFAVLIGVAVHNVSKNVSHQDHQTPVTLKHPSLSDEELANRLAGAIRIPTISHGDRTLNDPKTMLELHTYIENLFPLVHEKLEVHKIGNEDEKLSLLYIWKGSSYGTDFDKPYLLCSHLDVVPVPNDTLSKWDVDPFAGHIDDKFIWGRGTVDDKQGVFAILESLEWLLTENHRPEFSIYIAFGHDEEISGHVGAVNMAKFFRERNIKFEFLLDEGNIIVEESGLPIPENVALIGVAEKGFLTVDLTVTHRGGHSSLPSESAIDIAAKAVTKLHQNQFPFHFSSTSILRLAVEMLGAELPENQWLLKVPFANLWIVEWTLPLLSSYITHPILTASLRTTTASTIFHAGIKENVLPSLAQVTINHRLYPGDTIKSVIERDINVIDDPRVTVTAREGATEASPVSSYQSTAYRTMVKTTRQIFPNTYVFPSVLVATTDTRHYLDLCKDVYRYCPTIMQPSGFSMIHGINERIGIKNYAKIVHFYYQFLKNCDSAFLHQ